MTKRTLLKPPRILLPAKNPPTSDFHKLKVGNNFKIFIYKKLN